MTSPWVQTRDAHAVDLVGTDLPILLDIEEAAHALSRINRYTGHTRGDIPYNVAQHSVLVSRHCAAGDELDGLLHDLHEVVVGDVSSPVKAALRSLTVGGGLLSAWDTLEANVASRVRAGLGRPSDLPASVKMADLCALLTERRDLMGNVEARPWGVPGVAWGETIIPWSHREAKMRWLDRYRELEGPR